MLRTGKVKPVVQALANEAPSYSIIFSSDLPLHDAAGKGLISVCKDLLDEGADVHALDKTEDKTTALQVAAAFGHAEVCRMILERGAQANSVMGGWSALQLAISFGSPAVCAVLLQHGADVNYSANTRGYQKGKDTLVPCLNTTPLHASVMNDSPSELVGMLLKVSDYRYCDCGLYSFLTASRSSIRKAGARVDAVDGKGSTSLTVAASQGRLDKVALLLSSGADPNIESLQWGFALIISITNGHTAVSMLLIENGADVNGTSSAIGGGGMVRQTPLHACGMAGLLSSSSKGPRDGELETPMTLSTRDTDIAMAQIASALLEHGADVNAMMEYKALEVSVAPILMNL
jgi:ankyrin repeat protein